VSGGIYLIQEDGSLVEFSQRPYDSEDLLQKLLADYPNLLAGDQIDAENPRRWLLVSREIGVPGEEGGANRWSLDHLFLDQDGVPTLVEVKRSTDTRLRREVVGQLLDYAANALVYWPVDAIRSEFHVRCERDGADADQVLAEFLAGDHEPEEYWSQVKTNLQAGKVRLLFVADSIPRELLRVVEFLNTQMDPAEVLAVEIRQYASGSLKTLVPRIMGQSTEAQQKKRPGSGGNTGPTLDGAEVFLEAIESAKEEAKPELRRLTGWAQRLERDKLCRLSTSIGKGRWVLNLRVPGESSLVSIWHETGASISPYKSVFRRLAPSAMERVEQLLAPQTLGQGNIVRNLSDEALEAIADAYREARGVPFGEADADKAAETS
jgi:hypothetical protein